MPPNDAPRFDALLPVEMAAKAEQVGVTKSSMAPATMFTLAVLAGAFIALGALFSTTIVAGTGDQIPFGLVRLLAGLVFSLGLILVVVGGAELFTGNNLIIMAWAAGRIPSRRLLNNWLIVYAGNFVGSVGTALLVFLSGQYLFGNGAVGRAALATADAKCQLGLVEAVFLGILCNALVCLAVWLSYSARTTTDRILAVVPPITAFVAAGFEHSIANMYFIPVALFIKTGARSGFWDQAGISPQDYPQLTWGGFLENLIPVTIGNLLGGTVLVGLVYWFVYLRQPSEPKTGV